VATAPDGSYTVAWGEKNVAIRNNSWDIFARRFDNTGAGGAVRGVNSQLYGDQYNPKISSLGSDCMVAWTSLAQDGSGAGVFAQMLRNGTNIGTEFCVNTYTQDHQMFQTVASDGIGQFLAVWSSMVGGANSMDLAAQRYISTNQILSAPAAPSVTALASYVLSVSWAPLAGFTVDHWNLFVDGSGTPEATTNTYWQNEGLDDSYNDYNPASTHTFQLSFVLADGRQSPLSDVASGKTWGLDKNGDGLADDWETAMWGTNKSNWKSAGTVIGNVGNTPVTALDVFQWGADPKNPATWLVQSISQTSQGAFLNWNTQPGNVYQVQRNNNFGGWTNLGAPRFAAGVGDSIFLGRGPSPTFTGYRIMRVIY